MGEPIAVGVLGAGYVGLVSAACFAEVGHRVVCVDRDERKIAALRRGEMPIYEAGLEDLVRRNAAAGRLTFETETAAAASACELLFVAVGTPSLDNGDVDMSQIKSAMEAIAESSADDKIVVIKSTVPVGTGAMAEALLRSKARSGVRFDVVSNPEFLREGSAVHDTFHMDRIVIGAASPAAGERLREALAPFDAPVLMTNRESAELIKYASNSFLATKISFINEMANLCEKVGADIGMVAQGMGMDKRIGPSFLNAGIGYGGFCLPKDTRAQLFIAENVDYDFKIMRAVVEVNQLQRQRFVRKVRAAFDGELAGKTLAVMGLSFKPNTDDLRDAPSLDIIAMLRQYGASIRAYDPVSGPKAAKLLPGVPIADDPYEALRDADAMLVVTEWAQVKTLDLDRAKAALRRPLVFDGRNVFDAAAMRAQGFRYFGIGKS
ncbi:UDP-glucose/GDP-mannose dehydrogenase family protein [Paenibacillus antri]|uniref:UDP-glucose 6-dehydrogenase n=1 Tax=Paenibacillus antri TaxID=2582848 RepID=A0A5R9G4G3_9BACL|nr:UDP-glucose/GDP-mannose dehydrogenase family protein [Paenibacillus antri]TLS49929.1 UDP-glucose/GDP-mannose dehydrogenase family protein [Paenibacillus antri]